MRAASAYGSPMSSPPSPLFDLERWLGRIRDDALLTHLTKVISFARERGLDGQVATILGEHIVEIRIEAEARRARAGEPNFFTALPSVRETEAKTPSDAE